MGGKGLGPVVEGAWAWGLGRSEQGVREVWVCTSGYAQESVFTAAVQAGGVFREFAGGGVFARAGCTTN